MKVYVNLPVDGEERVLYFSAEDNSECAEKLASAALQNNQWAEILILANEKINDADWRAAHVVETF